MGHWLLGRGMEVEMWRPKFGGEKRRAKCFHPASLVFANAIFVYCCRGLLEVVAWVEKVVMPIVPSSLAIVMVIRKQRKGDPSPPKPKRLWSPVTTAAVETIAETEVMAWVEKVVSHIVPSSPAIVVVIRKQDPMNAPELEQMLAKKRDAEEKLVKAKLKDEEVGDEIEVTANVEGSPGKMGLSLKCNLVGINLW
ncbi:hypothetical protein VNO78_16287 [Psophocarpus tetragonolobus]|uniref:Uncharacterized protein n=1 Tax=Psophocarpus tetragonolobus TaxID=3891 RepID=A0AAN9SGF6_PSOTE